mmetsp:Transcript_76020/g.216991  ORF Transcript_76020/g.216991 Transcript_76020/m.216991 type:complete len:158 (+) Transcript_76020:330-803(+)
MPVEVLLLVAALELVCAVALYVMGRPIKAELELKASIREKKIEMRQYTTPALFVAKAKLERQVIKLDKDVLELQVARSRRRGTCSTVTTRIKYALFLALVAMYWSMPLFELPASGLWPLSWFFGFPGHQAGSVGVVAGVLVASQGSSRFVGLLLPAK